MDLDTFSSKRKKSIKKRKEKKRNKEERKESVTLPPRLHIRYILFLEPFRFFTAGDQPVVRGGQRTFLATTRIRSGEQEKIKQTNKHEQCLGLTQSRRRVCNTTCMCRLTLAWVTSENSTKQLECRHLLTRSSSLDPIFSAGLTAPVSGVDCPCP